MVNEANTDSLTLRPVALPKAPTVGAFAELTAPDYSNTAPQYYRDE
jgi:hypothetical protein